MKTVDIIFIVLFMVIISIIIGLNIVYLIDKKINNVSIKIPPIPKPTVVVNLCDEENIKLKTKKNISKIDKNIEPFDINMNINSIDSHKGNEIRVNIDDPKDEKLIDIENPDDKDVTDYDDPDKKISEEKSIKQELRPKLNKKYYVTDQDFGWEAPRRVVSCANNSVGKKFKWGKNKLFPFEISCGKPNKLTAENYYKTHYQPIIAPIEDKKIKGFNYLNFRNTISPDQTDFRILSTTTKGLNEKETKFKNIPTGYNYVFHNTPQMSMP